MLSTLVANQIDNPGQIFMSSVNQSDIWFTQTRITNGAEGGGGKEDSTTIESLEPDDDGKNGGYPTVTGLGLFLGFSNKEGLRAYKEREEFSAIVKRALAVVENHYETSLNFKGCTGAMR